MHRRRQSPDHGREGRTAAAYRAVALTKVENLSIERSKYSTRCTFTGQLKCRWRRTVEPLSFH